MYKKHVIIRRLQDLNVKQGMRWLHALGFWEAVLKEKQCRMQQSD